MLLLCEAGVVLTASACLSADNKTEQEAQLSAEKARI